MLDLDLVRPRFPALAETGPTGEPLVHADAPGGTQAVDAAIEAMAGHLRAGTANQHGTFAVSRRTDLLVDTVREQLAGFLGTEAEGVVFGPNMTTLTIHLARSLDVQLGANDTIVCTQLDHDANVSPWLALAARTGTTVRFVELDPRTGRLDPASLEDVVDERTRVIAFPGASNALGTVVDPAPFVAAARAVDAWTVMDGVHTVPHLAVDRHALGVDVMLCSAYKFYGPHAGILAADPQLLTALTPERLRPAPDEGPERWQTGTASFESIAGIGGAVAYLAGLGMDVVAEHEHTLTARFLDGIETLDDVTLHGPPEATQRTPTFAVTVAGHTPNAVAQHLADRGINVWAGHYYAIEPMYVLGLLEHGGAVRIGFAHYHGVTDVDRVIAALAELSS